jgi:hypothetical protein
VKKLLLLVSSALLMSACSETSTAPTASRRATPSDKASFDEGLTCRSGYVVAYDEAGNAYCAPDPLWDPNGDANGGAGGSGGTTTTTTTSTRPRP